MEFDQGNDLEANRRRAFTDEEKAFIDLLADIFVDFTLRGTNIRDATECRDLEED